MFAKSVASFLPLAALLAQTNALDLNIKDASSIRNVASTIAHGAMEYYTGNTSSNPVQVGDLNDPYYWWVAGALWGTMLDYYHYTGDPSYNDVVIQALTSSHNLGADNNYVPSDHSWEEGNDDLYFWGSAAMSAAERNFPQPVMEKPSWLRIARNVFISLKSRWDTEHCGGGLLWQIYASNPNGMTYKNAIANGGFLQLAARLARATGEKQYADWAVKIWDWSWKVGLIDNQVYHVYDGVDIKDNCGSVNKGSFSYLSGVYLYSAAIMANHTGDPVWEDRAHKLLGGASWFFSPAGKNAPNVMYEAACELGATCNHDMETHKAYLARNMWASTLVLPSLRADVEKYMGASAKAAAATCTGPNNVCSERWWFGKFDDKTGLGPQMASLETIHGWLSHAAAPPLQGKAIVDVRERNWKPARAKRSGGPSSRNN